MNLRAPKGTDDILPPASRTWRQVLRAWEDWAERFGYDLIQTPVFEQTELFARGVGESTEVVQKQMYTFEDRGGRSLTLRPEGTAGVVRAYLENGGTGEMKVAYSGPMFRYERPQAGRRRQFYQVGVEYLGVASPEADAEVIEVGYRFIVEAGVPGLEVALNSLGDATCRPHYLRELRGWLEERRDALCDDSRATMELNPMRVLDCKVCRDVVAGAPAPVDSLCGPCQQHFEAVKNRLRQNGIPFIEDPRLVRGLDYYTRTAFEYIGTELDAAQNAVGGGGRYDGLAESLGGSPAPGVGLALGIDRVLLASSADPPSVLDAFVVIANEARRDVAMGLVSDLRQEGVRVDVLADDRSMKAQFRAADRRGAPAVVIVGDEWDDGVVAIKDLRSGDQETVKIGEVAAWLVGR